MENESENFGTNRYPNRAGDDSDWDMEERQLMTSIIDAFRYPKREVVFRLELNGFESIVSRH